MKAVLMAAVLAATAMAPQTARAAVTYSFVGTHSDFDVAGNQIADATATFIVTVPTYITTARGIVPTACTAGGVFYTCDATQRFEPYPSGFGAAVGGDYVGLNLVNVDGSGSFTGFYFFRPGAFGATGVYSDLGYPDPDGGFGNAGPATLTVTGAPDAVPEASTWATLIVGFGALGTALRRRRAARPSGARSRHLRPLVARIGR